jgi:hypothetical protein
MKFRRVAERRSKKHTNIRIHRKKKMVSYLIANRNKGAIMACALTAPSRQRPTLMWDSSAWDREMARKARQKAMRRRATRQ